MRHRFLPWLLAGLVICTPAGVMAADDSAAAPTSPTASALQRQADKVERLKRELEQAQAELKRLEQENLRLQQAQTTAGSNPAPRSNLPTPAPAPSTAPSAALAPTPPMSVAPLPPLENDAVVSADDLVRQFRDDPDGATQRYRDRTIRVRGVVEGFDVASFRRTYGVALESPERRLDVRCDFSYLNKYRRVHTQQKGKTLVGVIDDRSWQPILRTGQAVTVRGRFVEFADDIIQLDNCVVIP